MKNVDPPHVTRAARLLGWAFAVSTLMNLAAALWHPGGAVWTTARVVVGLLFLAALGNYLLLFFARRRQRGRERRGRTVR
ncbi:hypothetical protein [Streptomyces beigongshangae]|uniref:hypothetical protein n=1 Tax=Streptomyces beigongshangae TaxID=2841597 RepID=UPI001C855C16|nr:hypothetical protein [Streptomyces sp. REN17]